MFLFYTVIDSEPVVDLKETNVEVDNIVCMQPLEPNRTEVKNRLRANKKPSIRRNSSAIYECVMHIIPETKNSTVSTNRGKLVKFGRKEGTTEEYMFVNWA
jgi:hypothetical protein